MDSSKAGPSHSFYNSRLDSPIFDSPSASSRSNNAMDDSLSDNGSDSKYMNFSSTDFGSSRDYISLADNEDSKMPHFSTPQSNQQQRKKSILDTFPWLVEVTKINQRCLGSIVELKSSQVLEAMDLLADKLKEHYQECYRPPKNAIVMACYVRQFLYTYKHLYQTFEMVST